MHNLANLVTQLTATYADGVGINQTEHHDLPNTIMVKRALERLFNLLFPGFFSGGHPLTTDNLPYHIGDQLNHIILEFAPEIERAFRYACKRKQCSDCHVAEQAQTVVGELLHELPRLREIIKQDVSAGFNGDPAATSLDEVIISYPTVQAVTTYRLAHELYIRQVPLIPRLWTEAAHSLSGADIHPGAQIGESFFIDHCTGVVIGETCVIGKNVQLYQGVTLGALAPAKGQKISGQKRHPTIEDNVVIYAGATILGGETVIGHHSIIGGNVWLTTSVAPHTKVMLNKPELVFIS